ncbi:MAG: carbohydrate kinase family protein [Gaiellaceae bacterium MAG52_C11]|nr:carbohydrate kinase family protein [Candidatus Gaiellasilicea maunaloa]
MIVSLGDLLLDVIVRLEQPLAEGADANAVTRLGPGGQAANVAAWVAELGGRARFVGKIAADEAGLAARGGLERYGVEVCGPVVEGRTGMVVSLVSEDGGRTMASDRGVSPDLRADELDAAWLGGCETLHLAGYSLLRSPIDEAALYAAELVSRLSVDLSSWSAIRDFGPARFRERLEALRPDVVFANEEEEQILGGPIECDTWILKLGPRGARFGELELPARPARVVDTTGAGDALAAGYLVGGPELALEAAALCVARLGSMP